MGSKGCLLDNTWMLRSRAAEGMVQNQNFLCIFNCNKKLKGRAFGRWKKIIKLIMTNVYKVISPRCSLEGLMPKLKLQYFGHLMQTVDSLEKTLMLGGIVGRRRYDRGWDGWMASSTRWTWVWVNSRSWWWTGRPGVLWFMGLQRVRHDWATELIPILVWVINLTA